MPLWSRATGLARFAFRLPGVLAETLSVDGALQTIREGVRERPARFLRTIRAIYANPRSAYRSLLSAAGCEPGDVAALVEAEGVEGALRALARAGVYVTYDELKCRTPAVRGSRTFHFRPGDFDDPLLTEHFSVTSGGTRGAPTRMAIDVDHIAEVAPHWAAFLAEHDSLGVPLIFWTPGHAGVANRYLACAKCGQRYAHWFVSEEMRSARGRLYAGGIHWLARRAAGLPRPEAARFGEPDRVLEPLLRLLADGRRAAVNTAPSAAVKLSLAAGRRGATLTGLTFLLGSEPLTPSRRRAIEASGARAAPLYGSSEASWIGGQCRHPRHPDEVHVLLDSYAIIPGEDPAPATGGDRTLLLTSLRRAVPTMLLNADIGDRAVLETGRCDCVYDRLGCHLRLHTIRSSDKITELGVTFAVGDVFHVLEEALPRRFGGTAGDYQLVEARDAQGLPRYTLLVSPDVPGVDEAHLASAFLSELGKVQHYYRFMASVWEREGVVGVRRGPPLVGASGKILPFHRRAELPAPPAGRR